MVYAKRSGFRSVPPIQKGDITTRRALSVIPLFDSHQSASSRLCIMLKKV